MGRPGGLSNAKMVCHQAAWARMRFAGAARGLPEGASAPPNDNQPTV